MISGKIYSYSRDNFLLSIQKYRHLALKLSKGRNISLQIFRNGYDAFPMFLFLLREFYVFLNMATLFFSTSCNAFFILA